MVENEQLYSAIRWAYNDLTMHYCSPTVVLFITIPHNLLDVNVHPNKLEVKFWNERAVREGVLNSIRRATKYAGVSMSVTEELLPSWTPTTQQTQQTHSHNMCSHRNKIDWTERVEPQCEEIDWSEDKMATMTEDGAVMLHTPRQYTEQSTDICCNIHPTEAIDMGEAIAQINDTYIVSRAQGGILIIDQHAAHERILLEAMGEAHAAIQPLLLPEILEMSVTEVEKLREVVDALKEVGLKISIDAPTKLSVQAIPQMIRSIDIKALLMDIANDVEFYEHIIAANVQTIRSAIACHSSIKAGKILSVAEMDAILRMMEETPFFSQCNHGRPTYIRLSYDHIAKTFKRE